MQTGLAAIRCTDLRTTDREFPTIPPMEAICFWSMQFASNGDQMLFCHWNVQMQHVYSWHPFSLLTGNKAVVKGKCLFLLCVSTGRFGYTCDVPQQLQQFTTDSMSTVAQRTNKLCKVSRHILRCVSQLVMPYVWFRAKQNATRNVISLLLWPRKRIKWL